MINLRKILSFSITLIVLIFVFFVYIYLKYQHKVDWDGYKSSLCFFNDSIKKNIDTTFCYCSRTNTDVYNKFIYFDSKKKYHIIIWEFKNLYFLDQKTIKVNSNINIDKVNFFASETFNPLGCLNIIIKFNMNLSNSFNINIDEISNLEKRYHGKTYEGFLGHINKMTFSDDKDNHQIIFKSKKGLLPLFLFYLKNMRGFFVVIMYPEESIESIDDKILHIFNFYDNDLGICSYRVRSRGFYNPCEYLIFKK